MYLTQRDLKMLVPAGCSWWMCSIGTICIIKDKTTLLLIQINEVITQNDLVCSGGGACGACAVSRAGALRPRSESTPALACLATQGNYFIAVNLKFLSSKTGRVIEPALQGGREGGVVRSHHDARRAASIRYALAVTAMLFDAVTWDTETFLLKLGRRRREGRDRRWSRHRPCCSCTQ